MEQKKKRSSFIFALHELCGLLDGCCCWLPVGLVGTASRCATYLPCSVALVLAAGEDGNLIWHLLFYHNLVPHFGNVFVGYSLPFSLFEKTNLVGFGGETFGWNQFFIGLIVYVYFKTFRLINFFWRLIASFRKHRGECWEITSLFSNKFMHGTSFHTNLKAIHTKMMSNAVNRNISFKNT